MKALLPFAFLLIASPALAQNAAVRYELSFPNAVHHEAEISVVFSELPPGPLEVRMSRSSPGRYALHEFAKNAHSVKAYDARGRELVVTRPDPYGWTVAGHDGVVRFTYTLFADRADGTYSGIDATHAHLNVPATFAWARGLEERPITVTFRAPAGSGWKAATQLVPTADPLIFTAPDLQYFMDSPTELSDFTLREWVIRSEGRPYTIRLAVHHEGTPAEVEAYAAMAEKVVAEQMAVFGELPRFDYGSYTFLADYLPWAAGDGMEHRNSTILTSTRSLREGALGNLGTLSHEFFHAWNMERLRSRAIEPFDFERANMSGELWLGEGFTSYYDDLAIRRAGLTTLEDYARGLAGTLNTVINMPGRRFRSPVEMSRMAPFVDAATSVDPTSFANTFISYYTWGAAIGLGLDLTLRTRFDGLTLDDYMRALWQAHGRPEKPYTLDDLQAVLAQVTKEPAFAEEFFRKYIRGRNVVDYEALLARAGLLLRRANPGRATLGPAQIQYANGEARIVGPTLIGTPLYDAGVDRGDRIIRIADRPITSARELDAVLAAHRPGQTVTITFEQRGETKRKPLTLEEDERLEVVTFEEATRPVPPAVRRFREAWLGSRQGAAPQKAG